MGFEEVRGSGKGFFDTGVNNMICVTPTSMVFVPQLGRLLSAEELCTFQGLLMTDFLPLQNCFAHRPRDLLGGESNVFCQSDAGIAIKAKEEFRTPSDGNAYSWEEFVTFFGKDYGLIAWARCRSASPEEKHRALLARLRQHVMRLHARLHAKFFLRAAGHRLDW